MEYTIFISEEFMKNDPDCIRYLGAIQAMVSRMDFSFHKYGLMARKYPGEAHAIESARQRSWMYDGVGEPVPGKLGNTGNVENCFDSANFYVIEGIFPSHPKAHFRAQESRESPGLVMKDGGERFNYTPQPGAYDARKEPR